MSGHSLGSRPRNHKSGSGDYSKFGSVRIFDDGRVRFSARAFPGLPELDFLVIHQDDPSSDGIVARWRGQSIFHVFIARGRVESTCFDYTLTPDALREAVTVLREAGNGLESWIIPGLEWCQTELARLKTSTNRKALNRTIPELLESVRDLPVAVPWLERRRNLEPTKPPVRRPNKVMSRSRRSPRKGRND